MRGNTATSAFKLEQRGTMAGSMIEKPSVSRKRTRRISKDRCDDGRADGDDDFDCDDGGAEPHQKPTPQIQQSCNNHHQPPHLQRQYQRTAATIDSFRSDDLYGDDELLMGIDMQAFECINDDDRRRDGVMTNEEHHHTTGSLQHLQHQSTTYSDADPTLSEFEFNADEVFNQIDELSGTKICVQEQDIPVSFDHRVDPDNVFSSARSTTMGVDVSGAVPCTKSVISNAVLGKVDVFASMLRGLLFLTLVSYFYNIHLVDA